MDTIPSDSTLIGQHENTFVCVGVSFTIISQSLVPNQKQYF